MAHHTTAQKKLSSSYPTLQSSGLQIRDPTLGDAKAATICPFLVRGEIEGLSHGHSHDQIDGDDRILSPTRSVTQIASMVRDTATRYDYDSDHVAKADTSRYTLGEHAIAARIRSSGLEFSQRSAQRYCRLTHMDCIPVVLNCLDAWIATEDTVDELIAKWKRFNPPHPGTSRRTLASPDAPRRAQTRHPMAAGQPFRHSDQPPHSLRQ